MAHEVEIDGKPFLWGGVHKDLNSTFALFDKIDCDPDNPKDVELVRSSFARFGLDEGDLDDIIEEWIKYKRAKLSVFEEALADVDM